MPELPTKLASPAYLTANVFVPDVVGAKVQVPVATEPEHVAPLPSWAATVPVGVPAPGAVAVTE